ncbi:lamin-L(II)-like [Mya arenaria]|uniref:lamin-L(II)-like n=1 Tax=Mya arenaria TaxID=6604 RepID=UPI0022E2D3AB|nr:lamin-L(II)-like [Mya arenaria]XP_052786567.1 lamin-L(II)-like [Mya arenaria]
MGYGNDGRMEEKKDMIYLNNKLADYMQRVRNMGPGQNSQIFLETLRNIECEVEKLKKLYESELDKLRKKVDEANRLKNDAASDAEKNRRLACDFDERYRAEKDKNAALSRELDRLQRMMGELEKELAVAKSSAANPKAQLAQAQNDLAREAAKYKELCRELDQEKANNKQLNDQNKVLQQTKGFNDQVKSEQLKDANNKLDQAKKLIADLERRNKDLERQVATLPEMVEEMRKKNNRDLEKYKQAMEAENRQNHGMLRQQFEEQIAQLKADNEKMNKENERLMKRLRELEGQVNDLGAQKAVLEQQLAQERTRSSDKLRDLERRLRELQDMLQQKINEMNAGKETEHSLKAEIETYRILLNEESKRLDGEGGDTTGRRPLSRSYAGRATTPPGSSNARCRPGSPSQRARGPNTFRGDPRTTYQSAYGHRGWNKSKTSNDGFPALQSGNSKLYAGNSWGNSGCGNTRSLPKVYA